MQHVILRLLDSTTLIAKIDHSDNDEFLLDEPMQFNIRLDQNNQPMVSMLKFLPYSKNTTLNIKKDKIIMYYEPNEDFVKYYEKCVAYIKNITSSTETTSNKIESIDEEMIAYIEKQSKNPIIH